MFGMTQKRFWAWPWELRRNGVLGINARNIGFVFRLNPRRLYPRVDDKAITKQICESKGIPVPETYAVIERFGDIRRFSELTATRKEFVVKPARGCGGRGVLVIAGHIGTEFYVLGGQTLSLAEMRYHLSSTLSGLYSLGGRPDKVIIEQRITVHPVFENLAYGGTPDVRVIVHRYTPFIAMLRLPTRESRGRANLHQGAVGVGIDMRTGRTTSAVCHDRRVARHPDTGLPIHEIEIPFWSEILAIAVNLSRALELGYIGIDILLDEKRGPLVLEANARPGLSIQIANGYGLLSRRRYVGRARVSPPAVA